MTLFDLFGASWHHTVLLFTTTDVNVQRSVLDAVKQYPQGTSKTAIIQSEGNARMSVSHIGADHVFDDYSGSACATYESAVSKGLHVIVVRPDGVVDAIVGDVDGLKEYFELIFV